MAPATARLYLLCFALYRFRQINDTLIEAFLYWVNQYEEQAKHAAELALQQALTDAAENLQAAGQVLNLFVDPSIVAETPFAQVQQQAFSLLAPESFPRRLQLHALYFPSTKRASSGPTTPASRSPSNVICAISSRISSLESGWKMHRCLRQSAFSRGSCARTNRPVRLLPLRFPETVIPKSLQRYLFTAEPGQEKRLEVDRYEFLLYRLLR